MKGIHSAHKRRLRTLVRAQFDGRCAYCDTIVGLADGTIDHYLPQALGGTNALPNLRWCCEPCNQAKGDMDPNDWVQQLPPKAPPSPSARVAALQKIAERAAAAGVAS